MTETKTDFHFLSCRKILFCFLVFVAVNSSGQQLQDILRFNHFTNEEGYRGGPIVLVYEDSHKFIWIFGRSLLTRFDGLTSREYSPGSKDSLSYLGTQFMGRPFEDAEGNIWFLTTEALNCYVRAADNFAVYRYPDEVKPETTNGFALLLKDSTILIREIDLGLFREFDIESGKFRDISRDEYMTKLNTIGLLGYTTLKDYGAIYFSPDYNEEGKLTAAHVSGLEGDTTLLDFSQHQAEWISDGMRENDSTVWFKSDKGLLRINTVSKEYKTFATGSEPEGLFFPMMDRAAREIYFVANAQLCVFDLKEKKVTSRHHHDDAALYSLANPSMPDLLSDEVLAVQHALTGGIDYISRGKKKFRHYLDNAEAKQLGTDCFVRCMAEDGDSNVWCCLQNGNILVVNHEKEIVSRYDDVIDNPVPGESGYEQIMRDNKGRMWISSWRGLVMFNPETKKFTNIKNSFEEVGKPNSFSATLQLNDGRIMALGSYHGNYWLAENSGNYSFQPFILGLKGGGYFTSCFQDSEGRLFVSNNVYLFVLKENDQHNFDVIHTFNIGQPAKHFYEDPDGKTMWIATGSGLMKMNKQDFSYSIITEKDGLPNGNVYSVLPDGKGNLWMGTNNGLCRFSPALWDSKDKLAFRNYTAADGLQSTEFNTNAFFIHSNGEFWMGGMNGFNTFFPDSVKDMTLPVSVQFTALQVNDKLYRGSVYIGEATELTFPFSQNTLSFDVVAIEYADPKNCRIQYLLDGYEKEWVELKNPGFIRFPNLPHGQYTLRIRAFNSDGVMNEEERKLSITILPPWYRTNLFYGVCVLFILGAAYSFYRYRLNQIIRIQNVRNKIARDLHDDVGSTLGSISFYSEVAKMRAMKGSGVTEALEKIGNASRDTIEKMSDIVWSVQSENDSMEQLATRMQSYSALLLTARSISHHFIMPNELLKTKLNMEQRKAVFMIFKEAVYNAARYSKCQNIRMEFSAIGKMVLMKIADDGTGIKTEEKISMGGNGITNMQQRAAEIGGSLEIDSNSSGTTIKLSFRT